jgi:homoaconitase/3-isopropylmalate dehydratase large subunit
MAPDAVTWQWLTNTLRRTRPGDCTERIAQFRQRALVGDSDADYAREYRIDLSQVEPMISCPHAVDHARALSQLPKTRIDLGFLGTCTNGRLEDIAVASQVVRGKQLRARLLVIPASSQILRDASEAGYLADLIDAGATIGTPGCGPCMGNHMGVLAPGEICVSSANRNFRGRMGERDAEIYLANPAVVAASCVAGRLIHPSQLA